MALIDKGIPENLPPLNFDSLLIISYGRSGSTLLQGILNSIDGVVVNGENYNFCYGLYQSYKALIKSKTQHGLLAQNPFYGSEILDVDYFLSQTKETIKTLLLGDKKDNQNIRCYGFKEIRYDETYKDLEGFLIFLEKIFPNPCFVFNTRNKEEVVKSWINLGWVHKSKKEKSLDIIEQVDTAFFNAHKLRQTNSFHITYEGIIGKSEKLVDLFSFLGAPFQRKKINDLLAIQHSYNPNQKHIKKLPKNT
jgi:hypothetical protein